MYLVLQFGSRRGHKCRLKGDQKGNLNNLLTEVDKTKITKGQAKANKIHKSRTGPINRSPNKQNPEVRRKTRNRSNTGISTKTKHGTEELKQNTDRNAGLTDKEKNSKTMTLCANSTSNKRASL